jgi:hypothetical protein
MFSVGMSSYPNSFFTITSMVVGIPTGIKIFNWLGTIWGGRIIFKTPMLFCLGFLFQFLVAGLTGRISLRGPAPGARENPGARAHPAARLGLLLAGTARRQGLGPPHPLSHHTAREPGSQG